MAFGEPVAHFRLAESDPEENLAASTAAGTSQFGRAKLFQLAFATAAVAGCGTFAASFRHRSKVKNGMAIAKVQSKYKVGKQWRVYDENCIAAPDLCPYGTKCMLKDDSWAACLYPGQCEPGKFVKIECGGPDNQQVFDGETTYCKKWECCTLTEPRRPPFEEDVYSDKLPADYKPHLACGPVAPPDRLSPHPWQPACEKNGCPPPTTTGCLTSTTPGCPPVETTGDATSTAESVVTTVGVETTGKQTTTIAGTTALSEGATATEEAATTESATTGVSSAEGATTPAAATSPAPPTTTTEASATTEAASPTEAASTTESSSTTGAASTTEATSTTEVSSATEASSTTRITTVPPPPRL